MLAFVRIAELFAPIATPVVIHRIRQAVSADFRTARAGIGSMIYLARFEREIQGNFVEASTS